MTENITNYSTRVCNNGTRLQYKDTHGFIKTMGSFEKQDPRSLSAFYQGVFGIFLDGLILDNPTTTRKAARILNEFGSPFADTLPELAHTHETVCGQYNTNDEEWTLLIGNSIRAYVYSGFPVNKNQVLLVASKAEMNKEELRSWIDPAQDEAAFAEAFGGEDAYKNARNTVAGVGRNALESLEITPPPGE